MIFEVKFVIGCINEPASTYGGTVLMIVLCLSRLYNATLNQKQVTLKADTYFFFVPSY